jgi:16S rRNA (cytosine1402-N4)-methyltransferase
MEFRHAPVMPEEALHFLDPRPGGVYVDGTLGGGGHSRLILEANSPDGILYAFDRDRDALTAAGEHLAEFGDRFSARSRRHRDRRVSARSRRLLSSA